MKTGLERATEILLYLSIAEAVIAIFVCFAFEVIPVAGGGPLNILLTLRFPNCVIVFF